MNDQEKDVKAPAPDAPKVVETPLGVSVPPQLGPDGEPLKQYVMILAAAVVTPEEAASLREIPPVPLINRNGQPVSQLPPTAYIGITPGAVTMQIAKNITDAFEKSEVAIAKRKAKVEELRETEEAVLREGLKDVLKLPEEIGSITHIIGGYTVPMVIEAMLARLSRGEPLFTVKLGQELNQDIGVRPTDEAGLNARADIIATQIGSQPEDMQQAVMANLLRSWPQLYAAVHERFSNPAKFGVDPNSPVKIYRTPATGLKSIGLPFDDPGEPGEPGLPGVATAKKRTEMSIDSPTPSDPAADADIFETAAQARDVPELGEVTPGPVIPADAPPAVYPGPKGKLSDGASACGEGGG